MARNTVKRTLYLDNLGLHIVDLHTELEAELVELLVGVGATNGGEQMFTNEGDVGHLYTTFYGVKSVGTLVNQSMDMRCRKRLYVQSPSDRCFR